MRSTLVFILVALVILAGCGTANPPTPSAADGQLSLRFEPDPPAVGAAALIVTLTKSDGTPIDGATLRVHGDMSHEGMMPIDVEVNTSTNGEYTVPFEWSMGGTWILTVTAVLPDNGGEISETFDTFVEAISSESIIRQANEGTPEVTPLP